MSTNNGGDTVQQAFWRGLAEALDGNENGITYDDDPTSPRSEAYDHGKTIVERLCDWSPEGTKIANLIAAAPEMRETLQFVVDATNRLRDMRSVELNNQGQIAEELDDMERQARSLIARIDGDPA